MVKKVKKKPAAGPKPAVVGDAAPAATQEVTVVARDVPEDKVEATTEGFMNAGATKVVKTKQDDGKFTLTATFPD